MTENDATEKEIRIGDERLHKSVLLHEAIDRLKLKAGDVYVDGTLGGGGHAEEVAKRFGKNVKIIGLDLDSDAFARAELRLKPLTSNFVFVEASFGDIDSALGSLSIDPVNGILLDLGLSSFQLEVSGRGFAFSKDEPLLMTFSKDRKQTEGKISFTARDIVNNWDEENIADVIYGYGEEQFSRRIAKSIVEARTKKLIETTGELAELVKNAVPFWYRHKRTHPATKTFQALRITVNDELETLKRGLEKSFAALAPEGRLAVISFHSLEDRIVKNYFKQLDQEGKAIIVTKKPIVPNEEEISSNPRSRSAKLRIMEKNK
jgi:16S rRNA (cytosine1402-N4)-methyltransferase